MLIASKRRKRPMKERKIGIELELLVLDGDYKLSNESDKLISLSGKKGLDVIPECSHNMVEFRSKPGNVFEVMSDTYEGLTRLNELAKEEGLHLLPLEMPLNQELVEPSLRDNRRYKDKMRLLGEKKFSISGKVLGFHAHYDLEDDFEKRIKQVNFLTLMDPLAIALTASSPYVNKKGERFNNWRTHSYRHVAHQHLPFQGRLQKFNKSYSEYLSKLEEEFSSFLKMSSDKEINFATHSNQYNSIWGPIRINPEYNTVELRSMGSNPDLCNLFSLVTSIYGGMKRVTSEEYKTGDDAFLNLLLNKSNTEESFEILKSLSNDAIRYGLESETVRNYCNNVARFGDKYLSQSLIELTKSLIEYSNSNREINSIIEDRSLNQREKYQHLHNRYINSLNKLPGRYK